jgi:hypothetical protein
MGRNSKSLSFVFLLITTLLVPITIESANALTPPAPTMDIIITDDSYVVPTIYSTDQNGTKITIPSYTVNSINISLTITSTGITSFLLLQVKDHFGSQWESILDDVYNYTVWAYGVKNTINILGNTSTSSLAGSPTDEITLHYSNNYALTHVNWAKTVLLGSQLDFRVQAITGSRLMVDPHNPDRVLAFGSESDWSSTQTITIPASFASPTPTVPEFSLLVIIPLMISLFAVAVVLSHRKTVSQNKPNV